MLAPGLLALGMGGLWMMDVAHLSPVGVTNGFFSLPAVRAYHLGLYLALGALLALAALALDRDD